MKITNKAGASRKSLSETVRPSTLTNEKSGAGVPKGNIVLGVRTMVGGLLSAGRRQNVSFAGLSVSLRKAPRAICREFR
jgi:hypothetical protein